LSALAWRVCIRQRGSEKDDPTIIRHVHDLAALEHRVIEAPAFKTLLVAAMTADTGRGGGQVSAEPAERFHVMLDRLATDRQWADEYAEFVRNVSFARADETIGFADSIEATRRLVEIYQHEIYQY
jgi:hypothetical protein